jgi:hypothetical protein
MAYNPGVQFLDQPFDRIIAPLVDGDVLTIASSGVYLDPHLVVLATLVTFWLVYIGLSIRDIIVSAI